MIKKFLKSNLLREICAAFARRCLCAKKKIGGGSKYLTFHPISTVLTFATIFMLHIGQQRRVVERRVFSHEWS